jgi:hypothetical protein
MYYRSLKFARKKTIKLSTLKENNPCENLLCEIVKFWNQVVYANSRMIIKNRSKDNCVIRLFNMLHCINIRILILVLIYKTSLTSPLVTKVSVPSHESDLTVMYVCVRGIQLYLKSATWKTNTWYLSTLSHRSSWTTFYYHCTGYTLNSLEWSSPSLYASTIVNKM